MSENIINSPRHYRLESGREAIDVIREALGDAGFMSYCKGNAIKYIARAGHKYDAAGGSLARLEAAEADLQKAAKYLEFWRLALRQQRGRGAKIEGA